MPLSKFREGIDAIDSKIVELLNARCELAAKVGDWKKEREHPIYVPERESALFQRLKEKNKGPLSNASLANIYREIISGAIALEEPLTIAITSTQDDFNHPSRMTFGDSAEYLTFNSTKEVLNSIGDDNSDYAVIDLVDDDGAINTALLSLVADRDDIAIVAERASASSSRSAWILGKQKSDQSGNDRTALLITPTSPTTNPANIADSIQGTGMEVSICESVSTRENRESILLVVSGHSLDESFADGMKKLEEFSDSIRVLSSYPVLAH